MGSGGMSNEQAASSGANAGNFSSGGVHIGGFNVPALANNTPYYVVGGVAALAALLFLFK